jgi:hypothetical protein
MQSEIEVTQADKDAAEEFFPEYLWRQHARDDAANAFARHRIATEQRIAEWLRARAAPFECTADKNIADAILSGAYRENGGRSTG